jgi:glyoxylase I family protein
MTHMAINTTSIAHVRLTVTDIDRSRQFYESVFGWPINLEMPEDADEETRERLWFLFGGVIYNVGDSRIGLRPASADTFDEDRTGLDHLAFRLDSKAELEAAAKHLDDLGIPREPIKDIVVMYILEFRDPDNIALELIAPK